MTVNVNVHVHFPPAAPDPAPEAVFGAGPPAFGGRTRRGPLARLREAVLDEAAARGADRGRAAEVLGGLGDGLLLELLVRFGPQVARIVEALLALLLL